MARRKDHTREELRALAIASGRNIIIEQGFDGFSARQVAKEIGYTIGTIYNIFESHHDFILHINAATLDEWYAQTQKVIKAAKNDKIMALAKFYLDYSQKNNNLWLTLFEHHLPKGELAPAWYQEKMTKLFGLIEAEILPEVGGDIKKAEMAARVLWSGIHGVAILSNTGKLDVVGAAAPEKLAESLIKNYLVGLKTIIG
jgi:AcrR family transcriptional regulator